jgi:hypothetical protein
MSTQDTKKRTPKAPAAGSEPAGTKAKPAAGKQARRVGKPTNPFLERHPPKKVQKR